MTDTTPTTHPVPTDPALALAVQLLGGAAVRLTSDALARVGWPGITRQAISQRRRSGTLPCREIRIGDKYYITADAIADAFLRSPAQGAHASPLQPRPKNTRRSGRPRKSAKIAGAAE